MGARRIEQQSEPPERENKPEPEKVFVFVNPQKNLRFFGWCFFAGGVVVAALYILFVNLVVFGFFG